MIEMQHKHNEVEAKCHINSSVHLHTGLWRQPLSLTETLCGGDSFHQNG